MIAPRILLLLLCLPAFATQAQTRAWLDRDRIAVGETATLNIETDQPASAAPEYSPLQADFALSAHSSRQSFERSGGVTRSRTLFAVALQPRREGVLSIPSLSVGTARTQPLSMTVTSAVPARAGGIVFIEAEADHSSPYVQQAVGYVLRLYYATQLISGQLDQDAPEGASLQRIGSSDLQYTREIGGRRYTVVERRYLLIPERSGTLAMPAARFRGRGVGGFFDDLFGDGQRALAANGPQRVLEVRPVPANAPQPWLPLRSLSLRYLDTPRIARAGDAVTVVVEATADGANATQMPELQLPVGDGAQAFAEPAQIDETFDDGRPQVRITRKFAVVPSRAGALRIPGPRIEWWDVDAARGRTASLADLDLQVAAGATQPPAASASAQGTDVSVDGGERWLRVPGVQGEVRAWALATVIFALLWLTTLMWALQRRESAHATARTTGAADPATSHPTAASLRDFKRALDTGDLGDVSSVLCAMATPPAHDLDEVQARLDDPVQQAAVAQVQRARWGDGDPPAARAAMRAAFESGPRWHKPGARAPQLLPPLYPQRPDQARPEGFYSP